MSRQQSVTQSPGSQSIISLRLYHTDESNYFVIWNQHSFRVSIPLCIRQGLYRPTSSNDCYPPISTHALVFPITKYRKGRYWNIQKRKVYNLLIIQTRLSSPRSQQPKGRQKSRPAKPKQQKNKHVFHPFLRIFSYNVKQMSEPTKQQTVAFFAHERAQKANKVSLAWHLESIHLPNGQPTLDMKLTPPRFLPSFRLCP